jgi:hypothetical protein
MVGRRKKGLLATREPTAAFNNPHHMTHTENRLSFLFFPFFSLFPSGYQHYHHQQGISVSKTVQLFLFRKVQLDFHTARSLLVGPSYFVAVEYSGLIFQVF